MKLIIVVFAVLFLLLFLIHRSRKQSIVGTKSRNRHFAALARQLQFQQGGDDYFLQLEGTWKGTHVLIYPHNFHGPGSITLFYADTGIPYTERTWIEPNLSLGRAIVEWKRNVPHHHEVTGDPVLPQSQILDAIERYKTKFPYIAVTTPGRFIFSHYVAQSFASCKNFIVLLVLDAGRKPNLTQIQDALDAAAQLTAIVRGQQE